jgi:hypothetical protein
MRVFLILLLSLAPLCQSAFAQFNVSAVDFTVRDRGATTFSTSGDRGALAVGYARVQPVAGASTPSGFAVYGFRQGGVLVGETGVPAAPLIRNGRIYVDTFGSVYTGIAIANTNGQTANVQFYFTDNLGVTSRAGSVDIAPNQQIARFLTEAPFNSGTFYGSFTFSSNVPIGVTALRGLVNQRSEFLISTLPVVDLSIRNTDMQTTLSHFVDGDGWKTELVMINPTDSVQTGTIIFFSQGTGTGVANPMNVTFDQSRGGGGISFVYRVNARSAISAITTGLGERAISGSVRITADPNQTPPVAIGIFSLTQKGVTFTEAAVPALQSTGFRMYVETTGIGGDPGTIQTGVAVSNVGVGATSMAFELYELDGTYTGLATTRQVSGSGQVAVFVHELFPTVRWPFKGILRVRSNGPTFAAVGLRGRYNERRDFLITTTPPAVETAALSSSEIVFPQLADSGGYTTQFVLFSGIPGQNTSGFLSLVGQNGLPLFLTIR